MVSSLPQLEINLETDAEFVARHIGITPTDLPKMLSLLGYGSLKELITAVIPRKFACNALSLWVKVSVKQQPCKNYAPLPSKTKFGAATSAWAITTALRQR